MTERLAIPATADPDTMADRYQVRILTSDPTHPHVIVDTINSDAIVDRSADPDSLVTAQAVADRMNQAAAAPRSRKRVR